MELIQAHQEALEAAAKATNDFLAKHGDRDLCGFAWVESWEKGNTKLGREIATKLGFRKAYGGDTNCGIRRAPTHRRSPPRKRERGPMWTP